MRSERFWSVLLRCFALLPLPIAHGLGTLLGWLVWLIPSTPRRNTIINLRRCFPELSICQRRRLLRKSLCETGKTVFETPILWFGSPGRIARLTRGIVGEEHLQAALGRGKGVLLIGPHLGAWEIVNLHFSSQRPLIALYRPVANCHLDPIVRGARQRFGARLVPTDAGGVRALLKALNDNALAFILPDQDPRDAGGVFAPFFNIPAYTMTLLPRLARNSGATPLCVFAERLSWGRGFHIRILPLEGCLAERDVVDAATVMNRVIEQAIALAPDQYQWIYKRFYTRPAGEPKFY